MFLQSRLEKPFTGRLQPLTEELGTIRELYLLPLKATRIVHNSAVPIWQKHKRMGIKMWKMWITL